MNRTVARRRILSLVATLALAMTGIALVAAPAAADTLDATCTGAQQITYSPGLQLIPRTVTTTGATSYSCQLSVVSSGSSGFSITDSRGCLSAVPAAAVETVTWNTGQQSTLTMTATVVTAGGITTVTKVGTVTSGLFAGDSVVVVVVGPALSGLLDCLTSQGLTQTTEQVTMEITSVL
jgi:hypothetical protein